MRHALGVLGVLAAGVLLAVSAAMNWRFGFTLGKTEFDGQIYGAASAAADCLKALVPFFFFAAMRNRMWSQAAASAVVWVVVTGYSLTSALGHAALNRSDTAGARVAQAQTYNDLRGDLKRATDQLSWVPKHRPELAVQAELTSLKTQRAWTWTKSCTEVTGKSGRDFCQQVSTLDAELASAQQSAALEARIAQIQSKLGSAEGGKLSGEGDPQAAALAKIGGIFITGLKTEDVQTALTIFIALLLEIGSGFGMYIAFSQWRLHEVEAPAAPKMVAVASQHTVAAPVAAPVAVAQSHKPRSAGIANDNKSVPAARLIAPETDVERFYKERIETQDGSSLTATSLYEDYCAWCEEQQKEPLALPTFGREFGDLGVQKAKIAGRVRYIGIALKSGMELEEVKNLPVSSSVAA